MSSSTIIIILLAVFELARAGKLIGNRTDDAWDTMDTVIGSLLGTLSNTLFERAHKPPSFHRADLDETMLGKSPKKVKKDQTSKLIVVSNRLPFSVKRSDSGYDFKMSSGGLVSAMVGVMDESMTWIGWPGISIDDPQDRSSVRSQLAEHKCVPVFLDQHTADAYYNGFCNAVLWNLFHYVSDVLDTNPLHVQWEAYTRANEAFLAEILPLVGPGDTVWVHDYHLMLLPTMLKSRMPSLRVGWFLHTPFPTSEIFRMLPMRDHLMKGIVGADLIGFHTPTYVRHFLWAAQRTFKSDPYASSFSASSISCRIPRVNNPDLIGQTSQIINDTTGSAAYDAARISNGTTPEAVAMGEEFEAADVAAAPAAVSAAGFAHTAHVASFPIGIAPERFFDEIKKGPTQDEIRKVQERFNGRKIMLGIDRLDPIKGIPHKLLAFEQLLEHHPEYVKEVVLVQIAVPSRLDVALTQQLQKRLHLLVGQINGRFGSVGQMPIHYLDRSVGFSELVALYAASSAMVITSLRDGMNLVSFEWIVSQRNKPGVLILSEFTGAADVFDDGCIMINPHDTGALAEAMHDALSMPLSRRQELHRNAYDHVTKWTASAWASKFIATLNRLHASSGLLPDALTNMNGLISMLKQHPHLLLLTDFDGTLTPIVNDPDSAKLSDEMRQLLMRLSETMPTAIVSGRSCSKIKAFVGLPKMWVAGAHGFDIAGPEGSNIEYRPAEEYRDALGQAAAELQLALAAIPGSRVEENDFAVSVHYRNVTADDYAALIAAVEAVLEEQPSLQRFSGKMVVELRPRFAWNKGKAVEFILARVEEEVGSPVFPIYTGDDISDEDAFAVLRKRGGLGILIKKEVVSREQTAASYKLRSPREVLRFFSSLANARTEGSMAKLSG